MSTRRARQIRRDIRRIVTFSFVLALVVIGSVAVDRANAAILAPEYRLRLFSVSTPSTGAPTDKVVLAQQAEIITFWSKLGVRVVPASVIERVSFTANDDSPYLVHAAVPDPVAVVNVVVHNVFTARCWAAGGNVVIDGTTGDCAAHEFGHILGLGHSTAYLPGFGMSDYGNVKSVMGSGEGLPDYPQLEFLGLVRPAGALTARVVLNRTLADRTAVTWTQIGTVACYLEQRGTQVYGVSSTDHRNTNLRAVWSKVGQERFMCGKWITLSGRYGTTALLSVE